MINYLGESEPTLSAYEKGLPWLRMAATEYIRANLPQGSMIFEWGAGGSTLWFVRHGYPVITVEHSRDWAAKVVKRLDEENAPNIALVLKFPLDSPNYVKAISFQADNQFDLVLVDGRRRVECIKNAIPKVKPGGMLCLDNSERPRYFEVFKLLNSWSGVYWGTSNWMTTIWHKPTAYLLSNNYTKQEWEKEYLGTHEKH